MAFRFTRLVKTTNVLQWARKLIDDLERALGNISTSSTGGAPDDAEYLVSSADPTLTAERVVIDTASVTWDFTTPGQASATAVSAVGPAGPPGATGSTGPAGAMGLGIDGLDGEDGLMGPPGMTGTTGATGTAGITGIPGMDGADGEDSFIPGPMGTPGAAGATGATGSAGPMGPIGFPGDDGGDGFDGAPGIPGPTGATGLTGATGTTGPIGPWGPDGTDGEDGLPGPRGADGAAGATGSTGDRGVPGADGIDGDDGYGFPGPIGPTGATGSTGASGATGPAGPIGFPGFDGEDGSDSFIPGPVGPAGTNGTNGTNGAMGPPGMDGEGGGEDSSVFSNDHNGLANLTSGDPHSQYLYIPGRPGGQSCNGGTGTTDSITFFSNAVDIGGQMTLSTPTGDDCYLIVGPGGVANGANAYVVARASTDTGTYPQFLLQNNTVTKGMWRYRGGSGVTDFLFWDELQFQGGVGGGILLLQQNGNIQVQGDGFGNGYLWVASSLGTGSALIVGPAGTEFIVDGNGNITKLNSVTTTCPTVNALGVLHNNGSGTWSWSQVSLSADTTGTLPIANGGTGQTSALAAFNALSVLTTRGDLLTRDATNNVRKAIGATSTVLGSDGTDIQWVAAGAKGGGLPTCTNTQTLRATGADTWAASSVLVNDGTNLTDSGTLTVQGAAVTAGTAGTTFTGTFGQGTTGTDNAGVVVRSSNGTNAESALSIQRNTTVECKLYANQASLTLCDFRTLFQYRNAANSGSVVMSILDVAGSSAINLGQGGTGTTASTITVNSGNSGTTAPTINLDRNATDVARWTHDGTDTYFDYTGNLNLRTVASTVKATFDTNGRFTEYRDQALAGNGVGSILASIALTGQSTSLGATNIIASTAAAGMYRASVHYTTTTTGNAVTLTAQVNYTGDVTGTAPLTFIGTSIAINTLDSKQTFTYVFQAKTATAITYQTTISGAAGTGRYALYIILERLS